ncbi:MAG: YciI family protein [Chthoniobacterales bacterium]
MIVRLLASLTLAVALCGNLHAQSPSPTPFEFDQFILVLLVRPANPPEFLKEQLDEMQKQHIANIERLAREGKMLKAGPTEDYSARNVRGIFILKTKSADEARDWIRDDVFIKTGRLTAEYMKWYVEKGSLK